MRIAYLIIAHDQIKILNQLIELLDYPDNDIFIVIDSKSQIEIKDIDCKIRFSQIFMYHPQISIAWGGSSMIAAELYLLKKSVEGKYDYYCLLSGVDIPLKSQRYIHEFLVNNKDLEYVGVNEGWLDENCNYYRVSLYHPLQNYIGKREGALALLERFIIKIQKPFVNRICNNLLRFEGGPQWFCITDAFCRYVLSKEKWIKSTFSMTMCADEIFIQTLIVNSIFEKKRYKPSANCYDQCCRLIDWKRGKPYIWQSCDYSELMNSDAWFARKFSEKVDIDVVNMICNSIRDEHNNIMQRDYVRRSFL